MDIQQIMQLLQGESGASPVDLEDRQLRYSMARPQQGAPGPDPDEFMSKLMNFLRMRSGGGMQMGQASDYLQPPRPPSMENLPAVPRIDLQSLIRMLGSEQGGGSEMSRASRDMLRNNVDGTMRPNPGAVQFPGRLHQMIGGARG